jgi:hypothetical protein
MSDRQNYVKAAVARLLAQYQEYLALDEMVKSTAESYEQSLLAYAKEQNISLPEVLRKIEEHSSLATLQQEKLRYERMRNRVADEMTFPTPEVWIRYKATAYKNTDKEIATWGDFVQHCSPQGYICTKRFAFLQQVVREHLHIEITEIAKDTPLLNVCDASWLADIQQQQDLMTTWQEHEFFMKDNRVAKWQDVT